MTFEQFCQILNEMAPGQAIRLAAGDWLHMRWNEFHHGGGADGFKRAVREQVIGAGWGTLDIVDDHSIGGFAFYKQEEKGQRTLDADLNPIPCDS